MVEHERHRAGLGRLPPALVKIARTSPAVRLRLSVKASTITATPPGA
jgi:hypothetical protein